MKYLWVPLKGPPITPAINFYCLGNRPLAVLATIAGPRVHLAQSFELNNLVIINFAESKIKRVQSICSIKVGIFRESSSTLGSE